MFPTNLKSRAHTPPPKTKSSPDDIQPSYDEHVIGIWRVLVLKDAPWSILVWDPARL